MMAVIKDSRPPPSTNVSKVWVNGFMVLFYAKVSLGDMCLKDRKAVQGHQGGTPREGRSEGGSVAY